MGIWISGRINTNEKDLGNTQVSGKELVVNKVATGIKDNTVYPEGGVKTGELIIEEEIITALQEIVT